MIRIIDLCKSYPGNAAATLCNLSLQIPRGSFFTLFGPSGCGKSTLLRCVAGLETPDSGEIEIDGEPVFSSERGAFVGPNRRNIGMVFQSYAIWPHMTVLQNVSFPLEARKQPRARERAREALELVGLAGFEERYASRLSGGQQQRVALARAIVANPAVLLLDEPLSNLDAALRDQMRAELQSLQKRLGITTIYVSHDQTEALSMSDEIAVMREGHFVEVGSPLELYNAPRSSFTAQLIGGANVLIGRAAPGPAGLTAVDTAFGRLLSTTCASGQVEIYIRPDKLSLRSRDSTVQEGTNAISCRIHDRRFAGEITEIDLTTSLDGSGFQILRCRMPTALVMELGEEVAMQVDPSDIRIFPRGRKIG